MQNIRFLSLLNNTDTFGKTRTILHSIPVTFIFVPTRNKSTCFTKNVTLQEFPCDTPLPKQEFLCDTLLPKYDFNHSWWEKYELLSKEQFINTKPNLLDLFEKAKAQFTSLDQQINKIVNNHLDKPESFIRNADPNIHLDASNSLHLEFNTNFFDSIFTIFHSFHVPNYCLPICASIFYILFDTFINTIRYYHILLRDLYVKLRGEGEKILIDVFLVHIGHKIIFPYSIYSKLLRNKRVYRFTGRYYERSNPEFYFIRWKGESVSLHDLYLKEHTAWWRWYCCRRRIERDILANDKFEDALDILQVHGRDYLVNQMHRSPEEWRYMWRFIDLQEPQLSSMIETMIIKWERIIENDKKLVWELWDEVNEYEFLNHLGD
jgi:hypothetical protein